MANPTGFFSSSRGVLETLLAPEGQLRPSRLRRPISSTLRSAYTFEGGHETRSCDATRVVGKSFGEDLSKIYNTQKFRSFNTKEDMSLSTTTGTDVSEGSSSDGDASDHIPKSTTSCGSSGGSDGSDSDDTPRKRCFNEPLLQTASRLQHISHGVRRPVLSAAYQKSDHHLLAGSSSCPAYIKAEEDDSRVATAREACASARGLGNRLGSELSLLDNEMNSLTKELEALKGFIMPRSQSRQ